LCLVAVNDTEDCLDRAHRSAYFVNPVSGGAGKQSKVEKRQKEAQGTGQRAAGSGQLESNLE
jgi:hypothetical protein